MKLGPVLTTYINRGPSAVAFIFLLFFSVGLLSVLRGYSIFSSPPQWPMTSDFKGFSIPDFIHDIFFPILILQKEPVFPFLNVECQKWEPLVPFL